MASLELVKESFVFKACVEFGRIVDDEDNVSSVDEPLNNIIEWIRAIDLFAYFQNARHFNDIALSFKNRSYFLFVFN